MESQIQHQAIVPDDLAYKRLDQIAAELFPEYSRSRIQGWIKGGQLLVDGGQRRSSEKLAGGEQILIDATLQDIEAVPEPVELNIIYEDDELLVINKRSDLVVHLGPGNYTGTILNGLLHHDRSLALLPRGGIVHRLDKGTTGLMVVAKTLSSQTDLIDQLQKRTVKRVYEAVVHGKPEQPGKIDAPIGRHHTQRTRMAVRSNGKPAITHYAITQRFEAHSHLELRLESGRTHQIRVHMQHIGYPLVGDLTYGGHHRTLRGGSETVQQVLDNFDRPALHAKRLSLVHPGTGREMTWRAETPADLVELIDALASHAL